MRSQLQHLKRLKPLKPNRELLLRQSPNMFKSDIPNKKLTIQGNMIISTPKLIPALQKAQYTLPKSRAVSPLTPKMHHSIIQEINQSILAAGDTKKMYSRFMYPKSNLQVRPSSYPVRMTNQLKLRKNER